MLLIEVAQPLLGGALARVGDRAVVLGAEAVLQMGGPSTFRRGCDEAEDEQNGCAHDDGDGDPFPRLHETLLCSDGDAFPSTERWKPVACVSRSEGSGITPHPTEGATMDSDRIEGKAKEIEGEITGDESREAEGEIQGKWGEAKDKVDDVWEDAKDKAGDLVDRDEETAAKSDAR